MTAAEKSSFLDLMSLLSKFLIWSRFSTTFDTIIAIFQFNIITFTGYEGVTKTSVEICQKKKTCVEWIFNRKTTTLCI